MPGPRDAEPGEESRPEAQPASGFRPLPPSPPEVGSPVPVPSPPTSSVGVPLGAVPTQRGADRHDAAVPRPRPAPAGPTVPDDEAVTVPVRRDALDRAVARPPAGGATVGSGRVDPPDAPALQPVIVNRSGSPAPPVPGPRRRASGPTYAGSSGKARAGSGGAGPAHARSGVAGSARPSGDVPSRPTVARPDALSRGVAPWETPPLDRPSTRAGLVAIAVGALGALLGLAPWSGLLPRVLPASAIGTTPVFNLAGALLGVVALGLGAVAMFRATGTTRGLLAGVVGACMGAAAIVVGLVV